jgi:hypothetical protein
MRSTSAYATLVHDIRRRPAASRRVPSPDLGKGRRTFLTITTTRFWSGIENYRTNQSPRAARRSTPIREVVAKQREPITAASISVVRADEPRHSALAAAQRAALLALVSSTSGDPK